MASLLRRRVEEWKPIISAVEAKTYTMKIIMVMKEKIRSDFALCGT